MVTKLQIAFACLALGLSAVKEAPAYAQEADGEPNHGSQTSYCAPLLGADGKQYFTVTKIGETTLRISCIGEAVIHCGTTSLVTVWNPPISTSGTRLFQLGYDPLANNWRGVFNTRIIGTVKLDGLCF
jgi:hypothetical protein